MSLLQNSNAVTTSASYDIDYSCRFEGGTPSYLQKNFSSGTPGTKWTWSCWIKLAKFATNQQPFDSYIDAGNRSHIGFTLADKFSFANVYTGQPTVVLQTTRVYRDPSAWYHIMVVYDSTESTSTDRVKIYTNGLQDVLTIEESTAYPDQNDVTTMTDDVQHAISVYSGNFTSSPSSWYLAEMHFIDGTALTPSSFAETDEDTNQWIAKRYGGSYGTTGFYLKFEDAADFGNDSSGNGNDWTASGLVATDQMIDRPTNNWCTFNSVAKMPTTVSATASEGNLKIVSSALGGFKSSFVVPKSGKFYCEVYVGGTTDASNTNVSGLVPNTQDHYTDTGVYAWFSGDGTVRYSNSDLTVTTAPSTGDIMSWYVNDGEVKIYLNNVLKYTYGTNLSAVDNDYFFYTQSTGASHFATVNFGQDSSFAGVKTAQNNDDSGAATADWYYAPPTGVASLCTDNLSAPEIALPGEHFNTVLYTGNSGVSQAITGVGFQPDFVWLKGRAVAHSHFLATSVGGVDNSLRSSENGVYETYDGLDSFDSDGFTLGTWTRVNAGSDTYVSWNWKAGGASTVTNNDGSIESEVSANTTAGFSLFTYTGTGAAGTVGHGLSSNPDMIIFKGTNVVSDWPVYYERADTGTLAFPLLDTTAAHIVSGFTWDSTKFTFSSASGYSNTSGTNYMAYAFRSVEGYSKVGTYTGNGTTDNAFTYTGFRPAWLLVKKTSASGTQWYLWDDKRNTYNEMLDTLSPDTNSAESLNNIEMDFVSNGFKVRSGGSAAGANAQTFLYMAFAESPFKTANAR